MDLQMIGEIIEQKNSGSRIFLGRDSKGAPKVKVKSGFLSLAVKRYQPNETTYQAIKDMLQRNGRQS